MNFIGKLTSTWGTQPFNYLGASYSWFAKLT